MPRITLTCSSVVVGGKCGAGLHSKAGSKLINEVAKVCDASMHSASKYTPIYGEEGMKQACKTSRNHANFKVASVVWACTSKGKTPINGVESMVRACAASG